MSLRHVLPLAALLLAGGACPSSARADDTPLPSCDGVGGYADAFEGRRTFLWRPDGLTRSTQAWRAGVRTPAMRRLMADAEAALQAGPWRVTDKTGVPEGEDPQAYRSMGPYWWPNPETRDGLPYVRRDGRINPERDGEGYDLRRMEAMAQAVEALALAHQLSGERRYADHAAHLLRAWFIDPETAMRPHMERAQSIPGRVAGRAEGVIDLHRLTPVVEAIGLIAPSGALDDAEQARLRDWFAELVGWMATSAIGREERAAKNNHALYYDMMIAHFAAFAGQELVAKTVLERFADQRVRRQFAPDGSLPHELSRTRSLHYSTWTMSAVYDLAALGECFGVDLWRQVDADGRGLPTATAFLAAHAGRTEAWPWPEIDTADTVDLHAALRKAARGYGDAALWRKAALYAERHGDARVSLILPLPDGLHAAPAPAAPDRGR